MNLPVAIFIGMIAVPAALLMVLRSNAALVFLSLCLGDVLVRIVGNDTDTMLTTLSGHGGGNTWKLVLLLLPPLLTAVFMIRTVKGSRLVINLLPALGVGLLAALLAVPLMPPGTAANIVNSPLWDQVQRAQSLIVGLSAMLCLFVLWLQRPKAGEGKRGKHHKE